MTRASAQLAQVAILARFISPQDYGLMAIVTVVLSYASLFSDMGLSAAFVQRQNISQNERSSLYWLSVIVGTVLMLVIMGISPFVAGFFNEQELGPLIMITATNFLVVALGQQLKIDAEKSLNFRPVALIEISAVLAGFCVALVGAVSGWGVYALVAASLVNAWVVTIVSWIVLAKGWRPTLRLKWVEVSWFAKFGGGMVLNNIINHVNSTVDILLGGRVLGASQLGLYSVPRNLLLQVQGVVNPIVTRVGFPLIASFQDDKERVRQLYLKTMNITASLNAPIYVGLAFFAPEITMLLLGNGWVGSIPLFRILAIWGLLRSFANPVGSLLFGLGHVRRSAVWNLAMMLIIPPVVWIASQWGAAGMAWAMAGVMAAVFVPAWAFLIRPTCGAGFGEYAWQVVLPTTLAVIAGFTGFLCATPFDHSLVRLASGLGVAGALYIAATLAFNQSLKFEISRLVARRQDK